MKNAKNLVAVDIQGEAFYIRFRSHKQNILHYITVLPLFLTIIRFEYNKRFNPVGSSVHVAVLQEVYLA
jgi:hypothetical protein